MAPYLQQVHKINCVFVNHCDESLPLIVSFAKETKNFKHGEQVRQLFHDSIIGGITNVFHRLDYILMISETMVSVTMVS